MEEITISFSKDPEDIQAILDLQFKNLRINLSPEEISSQGFVFVRHTYESLKAICDTEPAVVAKVNGDLAGYALCMSKEHSQNVPELRVLFDMLDKTYYDCIPLSESTYIACGQICIAKAFRGQNLMKHLYHKMRDLNKRYRYCLTEVSSQNTRSLQAHYKVGFQNINQHPGENGEIWNIVLWDWIKN